MKIKISQLLLAVGIISSSLSMSACNAYAYPPRPVYQDVYYYHRHHHHCWNCIRPGPYAGNGRIQPGSAPGQIQPGPAPSANGQIQPGPAPYHGNGIIQPG